MTPPRTQSRSGTPSATQTITDASAPTPSATLRLRAPAVERRGISWAEDVVDNEGMGKKSSKVCCIYHGPHEHGDESSGSDSSSSDDEDDLPDLSRAQKAGDRGKGKGNAKKDECGEGKSGDRKPSPNAYERQPKAKAKKEG
ncbi:Type 1 phosphatases regulator ypi1 [Oleoguttula sp. CCFEE 5521]